MFCTSCHHEAQLVFICIPARYTSDDLSVENDLDPVGKAHDLIQFKGHQQHCLVFIPLFYNVFMHKFDRSHIQSTGRIHGDKKLSVIRYLTGNDDLLLVSAGKLTCQTVFAAAGTDIEFFDQLCGMFPDQIFFQDPFLE